MQKNQFNTKPVFKECLQCKKTFRISPSRILIKKYCGRDCYSMSVVGKPAFHGYKHGLANKLKIYGIWKSMRKRCNNPNEGAYKNYGARGIKVDPRWDDFTVFLKDMGIPIEGYTLDRIDNNGGYSPENCRWATRSEQALNRRPRTRHAVI